MATFPPNLDEPHLRPRTDLTPLCGSFTATDGSTVAFAIPHRFQEFTIGRDLRCDQPLLGRERISRVHCRITSSLSQDGKAYSLNVTDASKNGTFVDGVKIPTGTPYIIQDGSVLTLGGAEGPEFKLHQYKAKSLQARYALMDKELGRGAFGTVLAAHNRATGQPVAVKVIRLERQAVQPEEEQQRRTAIKREVNLMRGIQHPHIIKLESAMVENDRVYLVMQLAPCGTLGQWIRHLGKINERDTKIIAAQLCSALSFLHDANIIHRDIKPANILIQSTTPAIVKVSDFGLATVQDFRSPAQTMCGTPAYMAPEVCIRNPRTRRYDAKADSWSVGITLIHTMAGRLPFRREDIRIERGIDNRRVVWDDLPDTWSMEARSVILGLCMRDPRQRMSMPAVLGHSWLN